MVAKKSAPLPPPPKPQTRADWCVDFAAALGELRPGLGLKYRHAVAIHQYDAKVEPARAAKRWTERERT